MNDLEYDTKILNIESEGPRQIPEQVGPFLIKTFFFIFLAPLNFFLASKTLSSIRNPTVGQVILLKLFVPSYGFRDYQGIFCQKREFSNPKLLLRSKSFRRKPPPQKKNKKQKSEVSEAKKKFRRPPKEKKQFFLKNGSTNFQLQ